MTAITPEVLEDFVKSAGFHILFFDADEGKKRKVINAQVATRLPSTHIRVVAVKTKQQPFAQLSIKTTNYQRALQSLNAIRLYAHYLLHHRFV